MSLDQKIGALTASLKNEFWKAWYQVPQQAPIEKAATVINSTTSIEHYINATPIPAFKEWLGHRDYGAVDSFVHSVRNKTFHNEIFATLENVEDDQTGMLMQQPGLIVQKARQWPARRILAVLAAGASTLGFDGTNFAANSHSFGSGDNLVTAPALADASTSSDTHTNTYTIWALYTGNQILKPMFWQNRTAPEFRTNAGTPQSYEARQLRWWVDLRGEAAPGYWWNAIKVTMTGLPNVTEMHGIFQLIENTFRTFSYPQTDSDANAEMIFEQTEFSSANLLLACSTGLSTILRQTLRQGTIIPQAGVNINSSAPTNAGHSTSVGVTNQWLGWADYLVSKYFD